MSKGKSFPILTDVVTFTRPGPFVFELGKNEQGEECWLMHNHEGTPVNWGFIVSEGWS
jgi:hypothetical protein